MQNFYEHIHPLFASKPPALWRTCAKMWWNICKNSDSRFGVEEPAGEPPKPGTFDASWADLAAFIKLHVEESEKRTHQLEWLATMAGKKRQWAACYCWSVLAYGVHSTQRIEALHSAVARWCKKSMLLMAFFEELESHEELRRERGDTKAHRDALKLAARGIKVWPPVYKVSGNVTAYAYEVLCAQAAQMNQYTIEPYHRGKVPGKAPGVLIPGVFEIKRMSLDAPSATSASTVDPSTSPSLSTLAPSPSPGGAASSDASAASAASSSASGATATCGASGSGRGRRAAPTEAPSSLPVSGAALIELDYGLTEDAPSRLCSFQQGCSCQLRRTLGILCRHEMKLLESVNTQVLPSSGIDPFWTAGVGDERQKLSDIVPRSADAPAAKAKTTADNKAEIMKELEALADLAATNMEWKHAVLHMARTQHAAMSAAHGKDAAVTAAAAAANASDATDSTAPLVLNPTMPSGRQHQKRLQPSAGGPGTVGHAKAAKKAKKAAAKAATATN